MLKKTIKYTDYNGVEREEVFYFNITKAELMTQNLMTPGGLETKLKRIINSKDVPELTKYIQDIIKDSYGVKSDDGVRFIKSKELSEMFMQTEAYSVLFMEMVTDNKKASDFVNGILPKDLVEQAEKMEKQGAVTPTLLN